MNSSTAPGIKMLSSKHSVDETVERLKNILESKGVTLFAIIDHSGEAAKAGMTMPPYQAADLRKSKRRHAAHVGGPQQRHRSAAQDPGR